MWLKMAKNVFENSIRTSQRNEFADITSTVRKAVADSGVREGICVIFVPHTTAAVTINENADPDVTRDIKKHMGRMVPNDPGFAHSEGNSDSHIQSSLFGPSLTVIIREGQLLLGTWQGIYFAEFDGPRSRHFYVKCLEG
jgi:secondary thiamine-phosphate synthase enzyme